MARRGSSSRAARTAGSSWPSRSRPRWTRRPSRPRSRRRACSSSSARPPAARPGGRGPRDQRLPVQRAGRGADRRRPGRPRGRRRPSDDAAWRSRDEHRDRGRQRPRLASRVDRAAGWPTRRSSTPGRPSAARSGAGTSSSRWCPAAAARTTGWPRTSARSCARPRSSTMARPRCRRPSSPARRSCRTPGRGPAPRTSGVEADGVRCSTLDLFGRGLVLLDARPRGRVADGGWRRSAASMPAGLPLADPRGRSRPA